VEAFALAAAVRDLPPADGEALRIRARTAESDGTCPLLGNGLCLLYNSRPLICRTHGLPLLLTEENRQLVDYCPENFRDIPSLPGNAVIGLDQLNATLTAVNALVIAAPEVARLNLPQRITIAEALLMGDEPA
jgi:Fe-S-cluster containining protein